MALACEVMVAIPAIRALIRQGRIHEIYSLIQSGKKFGMFTMEQSLDELAAEGIISQEWLSGSHLDISKSKKKVVVR